MISMFRPTSSERIASKRSCCETPFGPSRSPEMISLNWSPRTMLLVHSARKSLIAASLTTTPFFLASSATSIVRTTASSDSGKSGRRDGSLPAAAADSTRNRFTTARIATFRSSCPSRISPPLQRATTGSPAATFPPICRNGGSTKKASIARIATKTSRDRWYLRKRSKEPAMAPPEVSFPVGKPAEA